MFSRQEHSWLGFFKKRPVPCRQGGNDPFETLKEIAIRSKEEKHL